MRKIAPGVFLEDKYPGVQVGAIVTADGLMLIDIPTRVEDGRSWISVLSPYGKPRYVALLDTHPDRVLGARALDFPLVAHDRTRQAMNGWSDSFKGGAHPIGAEADVIKRVTGVRKAIPELTFTEHLVIYLGKREIHFWHHPGPTPGSMWVVLPESKVAFIGDVVTVAEPPYLGEAEIETWLSTLDVLRGSSMLSYTLVTSRDGLIERQDINTMARFLRKVPRRVGRISRGGNREETTAKFAQQLIRDFDVPSGRRDQVLLRLQAGLTQLCTRMHPIED
jgi:cyclase